ncbi:hypothetical protein [Ectopseudomonas mendocina]|uniref:hypothetical protein n=1 Tax=Ectopseudomonas mendocina TaxID=300 RepID=UPI00163D8E62|nr:hypothetical protein [Pseudomonas mendocina]
MSAHSLYAWVKRYSKPQTQRQQVDGWSMKPRMCSDLAIDALLIVYSSNFDHRFQWL